MLINDKIIDKRKEVPAYILWGMQAANHTPMVWPVDMLKKINKQLADQIQDFLPHQWKKLQEIEPVL